MAQHWINELDSGVGKSAHDRQAEDLDSVFATTEINQAYVTWLPTEGGPSEPFCMLCYQPVPDHKLHFFSKHHLRKVLSRPYEWENEWNHPAGELPRSSSSASALPTALPSSSSSSSCSSGRALAALDNRFTLLEAKLGQMQWNNEELWQMTSACQIKNKEHDTMLQDHLARLNWIGPRVWCCDDYAVRQGHYAPIQDGA